MAKKVEYKGKTYKISCIEYGYTGSQLFVNGKGCNIKPDNTSLETIDGYKKYAIEAIEEYEARKTTQDAFNNWDGKL